MKAQFTRLPLIRSGWRMGLIALFVALLAGLATPQQVFAATFTVTKPADTNDGACNADCSLREAIIAANASPGADVITLPAGTYTLSRSGVDNTAANGDLDVTDALTINGAAQATTIIQAGASSATAIDRVFSFNPLGLATGFAVSLNNLTIRNGKNPNLFATQENDGGCFDFDAGTAGTGNLSLTNVTVSNCETTDGNGGGVAIFFPKGGTATLNNVTLQNNMAHRPASTGGLGNGGGMLVGGPCGPTTFTINNSLIDNNKVLDTGTVLNAFGGGMYLVSRCNPTITTNYQIHGTRVTNNLAAGDGGGIASGLPLTIDNTGGAAVFSNNQAGKTGGGLWLNHPNQTSNISKVAFTGNSAVTLGGGIRSTNGAGQVLNVSFSRFVGNTAASGKGSGLSSYTAVTTATNNWWGCSTGPSASPCDTAQIDIDNTNTAGTLNFTPWLRLNLTAATNPLVTGQSTGLTASFLTNSNGGAVALSNLDVLLGLSVTWSSVGGTLSAQQTTIQTSGTATANYQATAAAAGNRAVAKVDNDGTTTGSNVLNLTVNKANTTATITADTPDPSVVGQAVTVSYNVTVNSPGAGTPTGNVTVSDGVNSCTATVAAGACSITLSTIGARTLTATYAGDANFNTSTSTGAAHSVVKGATTTAITTATPDPSVVGQSVVVQYTVTPQGSGTPTGNVTVSDGTLSCTATVAAGQCTLTFTTAGARTLTATYAGDANFTGSTSSNAAHTVNKADTTTTITTDTPDPSDVGQAVTVNYNVVVNSPGAGTPTGNVTVSDGVDSCTATVAAGSCALTLTTSGARTLTATYAGDSNFNSSTSAGAAHNVAKGATTTAITTATPDPSVVGQAVTVQYTVTPQGSGTPTGNVTVSDGTLSCTATVAVGQCTLTFTTAGARTLTATYAGDTNFTGSTSSSAAHTVNKADTTTTITADTPDPSDVGQAVTVNYSVVVNSPGAGTPTGNVTVSDGVDSCTATVAAGSCTLNLTTSGARTLTATYTGDSNFNGSTSTGATHSVVNGATTTAITTATPDPSVVGQAVTVQYTVTPQGSGTPTGNVTVSDGTLSCTATVAAGQCTLTFTTAGARTLTATYAGDTNFTGSTSSNAAHTVNKADTTTTITADTPDPSDVGQAVTVNYSVVVNSPGAGTPTGNVTVSDGVDSCTATVAAGSCTLNLTTSGARTLTATYAGDSNFNGSTSVGAAHTVNVPPTATPEIAVTGNDQPIVSGSTTPTSSNGTSFADSVVGSAVTQTFTIVNSGTSVLNLSGAPRVGLSGANAADFSVVTLPAATVAAGSSTTFQIRFTPSAVGVRTATVTIANNDSDENPYTFAIQGAGLQSLQPITQLTQLPGYTQSCTAASAPYVKRCTLSFTLKNTSGGPLQIRYEQLTKLSTHVYVLNGTPNPGQVGTVVSDGRSLAVNATFPPTFQLGLTSNTAYSLFFKVYGYPGATVAAGADEAQAVELGEFEVTLNPDETPTTTTLFLPLINH